MGQYDLYIGDSSEDEVENIINTEPQQISTFKIGRFLSDIGQGLLDSVRGAYNTRKLQLQSKKDVINLDKKLLENYLLYKKSGFTDSTIEKNLIFNSQNLSEYYSELISILNTEKIFFKDTFTKFTQHIVDNLQNFIVGEDYDDSVLQLLGIASYNSYSFLISVLKKNKYLTKKLDDQVLLEAIQEMMNTSDKLLQDLRINSMIDKTEVSEIKSLKVRNFIDISLKKYVDESYDDKPIINIYSDFITLGIEVPNSITAFYQKFINTDIGKMRDAFVRNTDDDKVALYSSRFLLEWINIENGVINSELVLYRPNETFIGDFENTLVNFLLEHKILKSIVKEHAIKQQDSAITHNKRLPISQTDEIVTIYHTGARADLRCVAHEKDASYVAIAKELQESGIQAFHLKEYLQQIVNGRTEFKYNDQLSNDNKIFLYKLADLLFNMEAQRNVGAFITNAMFFDLVSSGNYSIMDLPHKLPMTLKGAVHASRHKAGKSGFLKINHKFDYIESEADIFRFLELEVRNCQVLFDWLNQIMHLDNESLITLQGVLTIIPQIRELLQKPQISKKRTQKQEEEKQPRSSSLEDFIKKLEILAKKNKEGEAIAKYFKESEDITGVHQKFDLSHPSTGTYKRPKKGESTTEAYKKFKENVLNKIENFIEGQYKELCKSIDNNILQNAIHNLLQEWYNIEVPQEYLQLFDRDDDIIVPFLALSLETDYQVETQGQISD